MALLMAKVCENYMKNVVRVAVPKLNFDTCLQWHFRESYELYALDKDDICKVGDWILVRELPKKISLKVKFQVEKLVHQNGNLICPLTGRKSVGFYYADENTTQKQL